MARKQLLRTRRRRHDLPERIYRTIEALVNGCDCNLCLENTERAIMRP